MKKLTSPLVICFLILTSCFWLHRLPAQTPETSPVDASRAVFDEIDRDLAQLSRISGLPVKGKVAYDLISRDKVNRFLQERVKEVAKPEEIRAEELTLKKFGFVPQDFNLEKATVDLLTEQAAAFYDFRKKKLYITDWTSSLSRGAALVHELAHALADQNFNLDKFIRQARKNDDSSLARMAVMEGQASWLMAEYLAQQMGQSLKTSRSAMEMIGRTLEVGGGQFPVFQGAPLYLRETLLFPYTQGMQFQQAVVERSERPFGEVFRQPPISTQQIIHPEKYFARVNPARPTLPVTRLARGYKRLIEGSVGELDHSILLRQYAGKELADSVAPHWRGGHYALFEKKAAKRTVLAYVSEWDDAATAQQFFGLYRQVLEKKWKTMRVDSSEDAPLAGLGDDGYFIVRLRGNTVSSLEGLESPNGALR